MKKRIETKKTIYEVREILTTHGKILYDYNPRCWQIYPPGEWNYCFFVENEYGETEICFSHPTYEQMMDFPATIEIEARNFFGKHFGKDGAKRLIAFWETVLGSETTPDKKEEVWQK